MLPQTSDELRQSFAIRTMPGKTFRLNAETNTVSGEIDGVDALKQAVWLMLSVERYRWLIYSWNYGFEKAGLLGKPASFCIPELERRITEALQRDDRISAVGEFQFEVNRSRVHVSFTVTSIYGALPEETEVSI